MAYPVLNLDFHCIHTSYGATSFVLTAGSKIIESPWTFNVLLQTTTIHSSLCAKSSIFDISLVFKLSLESYPPSLHWPQIPFTIYSPLHVVACGSWEVGR